MTFSLVARCADTGMFGTAIASSSPAVAARCSYTRAGVGAVSSQNITDPRLGPLALDLMQGGLSAKAAISKVQAQGQFMEYRQVLAIDPNGSTAIHSGPRSLGIWTQASGQDVIAAMKAGLAAGGEAGPVHSAGLQICDTVPWPVADLRCDWTDDCPIAALTEAWAVYSPQLDAYVQRAIDPREAPSYGVAGDE